MKKKIGIEGMSCQNCVKHVKDALEGLEGVSSVEVNLEEKYATVETEVSDEVLKETIEEEGDEVTGRE